MVSINLMLLESLQTPKLDRAYGALMWFLTSVHPHMPLHRLLQCESHLAPIKLTGERPVSCVCPLMLFEVTVAWEGHPAHFTLILLGLEVDCPDMAG